ncbi:MAG TPA: hypothetical protein VM681_09595 [Candidatus Thermoplasmatota archaeon]|nr:hypothetical protein [Candidatus Thermoplasmatota archaeon]
MAFVLNPLAIPGLAAMALSLAMAGLIYFTAPSRQPNRRLALVLFFEAMVAGTATGLLYMAAGRADAGGLQAVGITAFLALPFLYLWFLGTLDGPLARPLRHRAAGAGLLVALLALEAHWLTNRSAYLADVVPASYAPWEAVAGPSLALVNWLSLAVYLLALAVSIQAHRQARTPERRVQTKAFAYAFGIRDVSRIALIVSVFVFPPVAGGVGDWRFILALPLVTLAYVPVLAYGILTTQLLGIDLKVKWSIKQSTLIATFVLVFFAASEAAEQLLSEQYGALIGIAAAGALTLLFKPVERFAERVADRAMPGVAPTPEYFAQRKVGIYRTALEGVLQDGVVTPKEEAMLRRLAEDLGVDSIQAGAVRAEVERAMGGAGAPSVAAHA